MNHNKIIETTRFLIKKINDFFLPGIFLVLSYFLFFIPPSEKEFVKKVREHFNQGSKDVVLLKDVVDFDWDSVCYLGKYSILLNAKIGLADDLSFLKGKTDNKYMPFYQGTFYFLKDKEIVKKYSFKTLGLRFSRRIVNPYYTYIYIDDEPYFFITEHNLLNNACADYKNAAFRKLEPPAYFESKILFTNLSLEKNR